jgi:hypothetical protein
MQLRPPSSQEYRMEHGDAMDHIESCKTEEMSHEETISHLLTVDKRCQHVLD